MVMLFYEETVRGSAGYQSGTPWTRRESISALRPTEMGPGALKRLGFTGFAGRPAAVRIVTLRMKFQKNIEKVVTVANSLESLALGGRARFRASTGADASTLRQHQLTKHNN
jgi:hypothetical protein